MLPLGYGKALGQDIAPLYTPKTPIPKGSYKTWSLFLINNPNWLTSPSTDKIKSLYDQLEAFGSAVGPHNLAVWFWKEDIRTTESYKAVDTNRAAMFCEKLKLLPSDSPHILFTNEYPGTGLTNDASTFLPTTAKYSQHWSLNNRSPDEIIQLLTRVGDKIFAGKLSELDSASEEYSRGWQRVFEAIRDFLANRQMTVTIKAPLGEVQFK